MIIQALNIGTHFSRKKQSKYRDVRDILILAVCYVVAAKLGLLFATVHGSVTMVWPPSGIALAALLILGPRLWPGVFLGAFVINLLLSGNNIASLGIACGNTIEAVLAVWLIKEIILKIKPAVSVGNLYKFFLIALICPVIAAIVGSTSLIIGGLTEWSVFTSLIWTWWLGDAAGILVFAPVLVAWSRNIQVDSIPISEMAIFIVLLVLVSSLAFNSWLPADITGYPLAFITFPFCVWAAYRYGFKGATGTIFLVMMFAIYGTATSQGPFYRENLNESLFQLQSFMTIIVITTLTLVVAIFEREQLEKKLIAEKERAEDLVQSKIDFVSAMSHELRTPLNAIIGYTHILGLDKHESKLSKEQYKFLKNIKDSGQHLLHIVNDLLDVAETDAKLLNINISRLRLDEIIPECIQFIEQAASSRNIKINYDNQLSAGLYVMADKVRLNQVLINLLSNATKYNRHNGRLTISCAETGTSMTAISISDTGDGIAAKDMKDIFEPFSQIGVRDVNIEGTGIGLAITRKLVERMHGSISVKSEVGKGSTFTIELPNKLT